MISPDQIIFMSDSAQSNPASSVTFVGPISPHSRPRTVVEIEKMSSDLLELVDQYDAIAISRFKLQTSIGNLESLSRQCRHLPQLCD